MSSRQNIKISGIVPQLLKKKKMKNMKKKKKMKKMKKKMKNMKKSRLRGRKLICRCFFSQ